jgi:hypothetical protein
VTWPETVRHFVPIPDGQILYTGMSIGYADPERPRTAPTRNAHPLIKLRFSSGSEIGSNG